MKIFCNAGNSVVDFAAAELAMYVLRLTKKKAKVVEGGGNPERGDVVLLLVDNPEIYSPKQIKALIPLIRHDGFIRGMCSNVCYIAAREARGILYGVYDLLERECGVVFAGPGMEYLPDALNVSFRGRLVVHNPALPMRFIGFHAFDDAASLPGIFDWMAKKKFNGLQMFANHYMENREVVRREAAEKRGMQLDIGAHSAFFFLPPDKYLISHPEYYAKNTEGKPKQFCYSNSSAADALAERVNAFLDDNPDVAVVGLWPEDGFVECSCRNCAGKNLARLVYEFVSRAAVSIAARHPAVLINHLAYLNSTCPPAGVAPLHDNVLVNFCDYWDRTNNRPVYDYRYGCKPLKDEPESAEYRKTGASFRDHKEICGEMIAWTKLTKHPTVFSYYSDLIMKQRLLTNVGKSIQRDMRYLHALSYEGFVDCCCHPHEWTAMAWNLFALGEFSWDFEMEYDEVFKRFCRGAFGKTGTAAGQRFYGLLDELENEPCLLGFNVLDLLHRNPREIAYFAGVVPALVEPCDVRFASLLRMMRDALDKLSSKNAPAGTVQSLRQNVCRIEEKIKDKFAAYLGFAMARK